MNSPPSRSLHADGDLDLELYDADGSTQVQPLFTISVSDEMDLLIGAILNFGPPPEQTSGPLPNIQSEFGTLPNVFFLEWKVYF